MKYPSMFSGKKNIRKKYHYNLSSAKFALSVVKGMLYSVCPYWKYCLNMLWAIQQMTN